MNQATHRLVWLLLLIGLLAPAAAAESAAQGRAWLQAKGCLACHSLDGSAAVGPTLLGILERTSIEHIRRSITDPSFEIAEGYGPGTMPTFSLAEGELDAIVAALETPLPEAERPPKGSILAVGIGSFLFILLHLGLSSGWVRPRLVEKIGEGKFSGLYSVLAIATLTATWMAWETAPYVELWSPQPWTRWVPNLGMPIVCILVLAGYTSESPTIAGKEEALHQEEVATGILRITRHPANMGFTIWGLLHLFPNGDLATLLLIFAFVGLGVLGTWHIERRRLARHGDAWRTYSQETSIIPFMAILRGDQHLSLSEIGWKVILGGLGIWLALLLTHQWFIGASPLPIF